MRFEVKMNADFQTIIGLQNLVERGRAQYPDAYTGWCEVGKKLASQRNDSKGHAFEHLDANVDLVLRCLETEQHAALKKYGEKVGGGVFFAQISLSKMWLFAVYEVVRQTCEQGCMLGVTPGKNCGDAACYCCQTLKPVRNRLNCFRIPLAKLQPEDAPSDRTPSKTNYHADLVIDEDSGSVGWRAQSGRTGATEVTSRLALSDYVLLALL